MASEMVMPTSTPEPAPARFSEGDPWVLAVYFFTFAIWTAAAGNDFISSSWKSVRKTRQRGKLHVALVFIPMPLITAYIVYQYKKDYKEMGAALIAIAFALLHLSRTFMGLWQLHVFKQWTISSVKSMESLGYIVVNDGVEDGSDEADIDHDGLLQWVFPGLRVALSVLQRVKLHIFPCTEQGRIERFADKMLVNETLIDNRLSDVHTVCRFRLHSKEENVTVQNTKSMFKRLCLQCWCRLWNTVRVFQVLFSLFFLESSHTPNSSSGPRLIPLHPESVWLNWATALIAQAGWMLQGASHIDPNPSEGYSKNRNRFAEQVLLSASFHTQRMTTAGTSTSTSNERSDKMAGLLSFRDWHNYPELCKGRFSKQELLKHACETGNGLPYCMRHREAKEGKDKWGYSKFKSELQRAREALPPELETRVSEFDVGQLEWFAIFVSVKDWAPWNSSTRKEVDMENQGDSLSDDSKSTSDSAGEVKEIKAEAENDIPIENVKKQLGFSEEPNFILGRSKLPFLRNVRKAFVWGNRNVLEISCHIDNWIALCAGEQTSYMVKHVSRMEQELGSAYALRTIDEIVAASAKFEKCRFLCQMAIIRPERNHFEKSMTFLGCSMEMLRSSLAQWAETNGECEEGTWKPRLFSNDIVSGTTKRGILSRLEGSDDFTSCLRSVKTQAAMSKSFVKMRVLWELQNHFQTHLRKKEFTPNSLEATALCILSFPALSVKVIDRRDSSATFRMARIEMVQGRGKCCVTLHCEDEEKFRIENYEYVIHASCGPQDLQLVLSFKPLRENSNAALSILLCEIEGLKVDYFDWEVWRSAFYGRLEGCRQWKAKVGISNFALVAPTEHIDAGIEKVPSALASTILESDTGTEMSVWKGWPPHRASICLYELTTENFISQPRQVEGVPVPLSMGEGTTFQIKIPQEIWGPVKYAEANESSFRKACLVAQNLLTGTEDIGLAHASDTDVIVALRAAVEQEILLLQSNVGKTEAVLRGVALLERFYVYGTHRPGTAKRNTVSLSSFFRNEKYVKAVSLLFERMFEASEYDECVAERYQLFLMSGMLHGEDGEEASGENALRVMFRSIVYRWYSRKVEDLAATFLVSVFPFHSNGSFEEYAALVLAYMNARKEVEAALRRRTGHGSLLEGVRREAEVRLGIVIRAIARIEGGLRFIEALGVSADDTATEAVVNLSLLEYRPNVNVPLLSHEVTLDFDTRDAEGKPSAPEGALKHKVLSSFSPETITAAAGDLNLVISVLGMGGVGKTIAMQGLAGDEDICARFPDGILYMTLGQGATVEDAIQEIARVMTITGATTSVAMMENSTSLKEAVDYAVTWFRGKKCLFLIDSMWPTDECSAGFLTDLRQLLRASPDSRMVISTRSVNIASAAGSIVEFGA